MLYPESASLAPSAPLSGTSVLVEGAADGLDEGLGPRRLGRVVARCLLGLDLDAGIRWNELFRNGDALRDLDVLLDQRIVFHVAHGYEAVDAGETQPMDHIRHQLLKAGILHAGDAFSALEIGRGGVSSLLALARVVDQELRHLAECASFLAVVYDDAQSGGLSAARAFFDTVDKIRPASADIGAEDVGPVALIMYPARNEGARVLQLLNVAEQIDGGASHRRQEDLEIEPGHELRKHSGCLLEQRATQSHFTRAETFRDSRQIPDRIDGDLDNGDGAILVHHLTIAGETSDCERILDFMNIETCPGDGDRWPDIQPFRNFRGEGFRCEMSPRVEGDDATGILPLRKRADIGGGVGIGKIGAPDGVKRTR